MTIKKYALILLLCLIFSGTILHSTSGKSLSLDLTWSSLTPADTSYKKIYGESMLYPEIILAYRLYKRFLVYAGYGFLQDRGEVPPSSAEVESDQDYISIGFGYEFPLIKKMDVRISGGIVFINYNSVNYFDSENSGIDEGNRAGYKFDIGCYYHLSRTIALNAVVGYFHGQNTTDYLRKLSYGGLKLGIGFGFRF